MKRNQDKKCSDGYIELPITRSARMISDALQVHVSTRVVFL